MRSTEQLVVLGGGGGKPKRDDRQGAAAAAAARMCVEWSRTDGREPGAGWGEKKRGRRVSESGAVNFSLFRGSVSQSSTTSPARRYSAAVRLKTDRRQRIPWKKKSHVFFFSFSFSISFFLSISFSLAVHARVSIRPTAAEDNVKNA